MFEFIRRNKGDMLKEYREILTDAGQNSFCNTCRINITKLQAEGVAPHWCIDNYIMILKESEQQKAYKEMLKVLPTMITLFENKSLLDVIDRNKLAINFKQLVESVVEASDFKPKQVIIESENIKTLDSFIQYCKEHPEQRFWQALRNWSEYPFVFVGYRIPNDNCSDTFNFKGRTS